MNAHPFAKWAGGKRSLLDQLRPMLPSKMRCYYEPFVGGGAMFFDLHPAHAVLSDANAELITTYITIRDQPESVIRELQLMPITERAYYDFRALDPRIMPPVSAAARMIYLNHTCFNGLFRVNKSGGFNVPWGKWQPDKLPTTCDADNIRACSRALNGVKIHVSDFEQSMDRCLKGDFCYLDPPYVPVSKTANFTAYTAGGFGPADLKRLALVCSDLDRRGVRFTLSNADTPAVWEAFGDFHIEWVQCRRNVNCDATKRGKVNEVVVRNYTI